MCAVVCAIEPEHAYDWSVCVAQGNQGVSVEDGLMPVSLGVHASSRTFHKYVSDCHMNAAHFSVTQIPGRTPAL